MVRDPRGGHNRYEINENFFKTWSPEMAYVLGYIYADGTLIDARKSSRTQYIGISSSDESILYKIRSVMDSNKPLYKSPAKLNKFPNGKTYLCAASCCLRVGNKVMFNDILKFGVTPRKSLSLKMPEVPFYYFPDFLRGYYDGDGCLQLSRLNERRIYRVRYILTSGSEQFLISLSEIIAEHIPTVQGKIYHQKTWFRLTYPKSASLKILALMYRGTERNQLYLDRKYKRYLRLLEHEKARLQA